MSRFEKIGFLNTPVGRISAGFVLAGAISTGVGAYKSIDVYDDIQDQRNEANSYPAIAKPTIEAARTEVALFEDSIAKLPEIIATEKPREITLPISESLPDAYDVIVYERTREEASVIDFNGGPPILMVLGAVSVGIGVNLLRETAKDYKKYGPLK